MKQNLTYYRVSTAKQRHSGLGLEAQRAAVFSFVGNALNLSEYVEVEAGKGKERPYLEEAIDYAKG